MSNALKIKPLFWDNRRSYAYGYGLGLTYCIQGREGNEWRASCEIGRYNKWASDEVFGDSDTAKAACNAHYKQQVRKELK